MLEPIRLHYCELVKGSSPSSQNSRRYQLLPHGYSICLVFLGPEFCKVVTKRGEGIAFGRAAKHGEDS